MTSVTARFVLPNGAVLSSGTITFTPTGLRRAGADKILTPEPVEVDVAAGGVATSPDLFSGGYTVKIEAAWFVEVYPIVVPDTGPVDLMDLIQQFVELPEPLVSEAWEAANAARQARNEVDAFIGHITDQLMPQMGDYQNRAEQAAIEAAISAAEASQKVAEGLAGKADKMHAHDNKADLGTDGKLVLDQLPHAAMTEFLGECSTQSRMLTDLNAGQKGDWCIRTDLNTVWVLIGDDQTQLSSWREWMYPASPVRTVFGRTGDVTATKADVGLGNVDNTKDVDKPVSTAQQAALTAQRDAINLELLGKAAKRVYRGNWVASTSYAIGDVVTANYAHWECKTAHSAGTSFSQTNWLPMGLAAIGATTDPGIAGWLWVKTGA